MYIHIDIRESRIAYCRAYDRIAYCRAYGRIAYCRAYVSERENERACASTREQVSVYVAEPEAGVNKMCITLCTRPRSDPIRL
jgi:hypothetical protein